MLSHDSNPFPRDAERAMPRVMDDAREAFTAHARRVKADVEAAMGPWLDARVEAARVEGADAAAVLDAVRSLAMRGGKRLRPALFAAAYEGSALDRPQKDESRARTEEWVLVGVALELLQVYFLAHDDWMDGDLVRRGGPSVHAMLRARFRSESFGDAAAILAGDHASALAQEALLSAPLDPSRIAEAARVFARIQSNVIVGQILDMRSESPNRAAVERMHALKTGSYTVAGPLDLGAVLGGASTEARGALARFAAPLGVAFQLRDDLLGIFGDPEATGKPKMSDLRQGKRTALVCELAGDADADRLLPNVLGVATASDADLAAVARRMVESGAKSRVEARLHELLAEARHELDRAPLSAQTKRLLAGALVALGERDA